MKKSPRRSATGHFLSSNTGIDHGVGPPTPHPARHCATPISGTVVVWRAGRRNTVIVAFIVQTIRAVRLRCKETAGESAVHHRATVRSQQRAREREVLRETVRLGDEQGGRQPVGGGSRERCECCVRRSVGRSTSWDARPVRKRGGSRDFRCVARCCIGCCARSRARGWAPVGFVRSTYGNPCCGHATCRQSVDGVEQVVQFVCGSPMPSARRGRAERPV